MRIQPNSWEDRGAGMKIIAKKVSLLPVYKIKPNWILYTVHAI